METISISNSSLCSQTQLLGSKKSPFFAQSHFPICSVPTYIQIGRRSGLAMNAVVAEEKETKQAREMAAARKRWELLIREQKVKILTPREAGYAIQLSNKTLLDGRDGSCWYSDFKPNIREQKVKILTPREAGYAIQLSNKTLLDVRPSTEHEKAWVKNSTWIPIFDIVTANDAGTISRKVTNFVMGGWWSGVPNLGYNDEFVTKVEEKFSKDTDLILACQKGLRSLAACEKLYNAGYQNLFWVQGGLEAANEEDLKREGPQPFKLAGIGGFSEFMGWTDQQRVIAAREGWSYRFIFTARLIGLVVLSDALFIASKKLGPFLENLRSSN